MRQVHGEERIRHSDAGNPVHHDAVAGHSKRDLPAQIHGSVGGSVRPERRTASQK